MEDEQDVSAVSKPASEADGNPENSFFLSPEEYYEETLWYEGAIEEAISLLLEAKRVLEKEEAHSHTMIRSISSRVKSPQSIQEKMKRFGYPLEIEWMEDNLMDIAGIRIVCSYIYDIYALRRWLTKQEDLELVVAKDYISNPKPSGYRSLHMIFRIPVERNGISRMIPCEMQIRTMAMDSWASLEHQLRYKKDAIRSSEIHQELHDCAEKLYDTDLRMQKIFLQLSWFSGGGDPASESEDPF